jgi:hypothetical protein
MAFKIDEKHSSIRMFLANASMVFMLGVPFTGFQLAENQGVEVVSEYMIYFELAMIVVFLLFLFHSIWLYIKATSMIASGTEDGFDEDL